MLASARSVRPVFLAVLLLQLLGLTQALAQSAATRSLSEHQSRLQAPGTEVVPSDKTVFATNYDRLPASFEPNLGQMADPVMFSTRGNGYDLFLTSKGLVVSLSGDQGPSMPLKHPQSLIGDFLRGRGRRINGSTATLALDFNGANPDPQIEGMDILPGKANYFLGNDSSKWRTGVPTYAKVRYRELYPGIDLIFYGSGRRLEYDFVISPNAKPGDLAISLSGASSLRLDSEGNLLIGTNNGELELRRPNIYQRTGNERHAVEGRFVLAAKDVVKFEVGTYDLDKELIIDPALDYSTYLGGASDDSSNGIAIDASGDAFVTGQTSSTDFPVSSKAVQGTNKAKSGGTVFVTEINPSGTAVLYSTYLGGTTSEIGIRIALDSANPANVYVTGLTCSKDFPTTSNAVIQTLTPATCTASTGGAGFVTKFNPTVAGASALEYSSYLGGNGGTSAGGEAGEDIAVDANGNIYVAGATYSTNFPVTSSAFQSSNNGGGTNENAFLTRIDPSKSGSASLIYSTYLGGSAALTIAYGLAVDSNNNSYLVGATGATNFPTTANSFQQSFPGGGPAFISRIDTTQSGAQSMVYSSFLGGTTDDAAFDITLGPGGVAYITGFTGSSNFPVTAGAFQTSTSTTSDVAFLSLVDTTKSATQSLTYSTYLGAPNGQTESGNAVAVDSNGNAYIAGYSFSSNFPVTSGAYQTTFAGCASGFLTELSPLGNGSADLAYSTFFDGNEPSASCTNSTFGAFDVALDSSNNVYLTGVTAASNFPVLPSNAYQTSLKGSSDAYVAKFTLTSTPPSPSITSLSVSSGITGTAVGITGSNFNMIQGTGTVTFGSVSASVESWSATSIQVLVPVEGTAGAFQVAVHTLNGSSSPKSFTVLPTINTLSPSSGPVGSAVTISGYNFGTSGNVTFGGIAATTSSWNATTIVANVPTGATSGNVIVTSNSVSSPTGTVFTVVPTPSITGVSAGSATAGTQITISGSNFGNSQPSESGAVLIGGASAFITSWSSSSIGAIVPNSGTPGAGSVIVTVAGVQSNAWSFTVNPTIASLSPSAGPVGQSIVIYGANFGSTQGTVLFGTSSATVTSWAPTNVTVTVPSLAVGAVSLTVKAASITTNSLWFTVTGASGTAAPSAPTILGLPPFGSFGGGPDQIDLGNLNVHLDIPVFSRPGRGTPFGYTLKYDSSIYYPSGAPGSVGWQPVNNWGWAGQSSVIFGSVSYLTAVPGTCSPDGKGYTVYSGWSYQDKFGVTHPFSMGGVSTDANCGSTTQLGPATDGTGYMLSVTATSGVLSATVTSKTGRQINPPINSTGGAAVFTDRNGNQISVNGSGVFTDSLGTTALTVSGGAPNPLKFAYTPPAGGTAFVTVTYKPYSIATSFGCTGVKEYTNSSVSLVDRITYQDGTFYQFAYELTPGSTTTYTGRLASVTLPTGGTISYTYQGGNNGIVCADGSAAGFKRSTPDTGSAFWNYARTPGSGAASTTTVTDPTTQANVTKIQFQGIYETQRQSFQGSSTLLRTVTTCYNGNTANCPSTPINFPIAQRNVTTQLPGAKNLTSGHVYRYDANQNPLEQDDYDYGSGSLGNLLKKTVIAYAPLGNNITGFPQQVTITDAGGNLVSKTTYSYDQGSVATTTGTPQHIGITGSRGNLTSTNSYSTSSAFLTKSFTYFDTGNLQTATDVNTAQTTYAYGACGNSFPTNVSEPLSLSRSMTWNCSGAVQTSMTDENGKVWSTSYTKDANFWRPESKTDPTSAVTNFTYTGATQVESVLSIVSGSSAVDDLATLDSMGRAHLNQIRQGPGQTTFDSTETDYDIESRADRVTLPFGANAGQGSTTAPGKTTSYDALGRVSSTADSGGGSVTDSYSQNDVVVTRGPVPNGENLKKHQSEYDALGRITSICEMTSGQGTGVCAQNTAQSGFWTQYGYDAMGRLTGVTQNAQSSGATQVRSYSYDLLGRVTSAKDPETGNLAYTYTYDTDSTCGTSNGDLVKRLDAVGNVTCFTYDVLHRQLSITYPSGSYATKTRSKFFVYDAATVNGTAMANAKAKLAEAYTCASPCSTKLTDIGMSYTVRGEPSDVYESTPNSGGYYHVAEQYWASGAVKQLSGLSSLPTFTFNLDGEGRTNQVSASSGQNPVTNTVFNNASLPTSVTFGSADSDSFTYDPNTDRMTQYQFNVNGKSLTGTLTWNANSTLHALNIVDALNSTDTQSCSFLYDDLARLESTDCGTVWSQTYSYDAFGNLKKLGSAAFQPTYSSSTNHITLLNGVGPTYDNNGNTLTDPSHMYSWDSAGKLVTVDSVNMTYDALGRMAEQNRSGAFTQFVYGPHGGKFAIMSGQTLQKAFIPLSGGAQAVYNASGLLYYGHSDHLGSVRVGSTSARGISFDLAYAPFGETYAASGTTDPAFTGQREDTVSGLYDFPAREYNPQGRWPSADPAGAAAFHLTDPQSFNRYAYARNTPLSVLDPTGMLLKDIHFFPHECSNCGGGNGDLGLFPDPVTGGGGSTDPSGGSQTSNPAGSGDQGSGTGQLGSGDVGNSPDIGVGNLPGAATGGADPLNNPLAPSQQLTLQLQAANVDVLVPENGFWGADLGITYQVTDQNGNPQNLEGAIPVELLAVTSQDGSMGQNMTNNYPNSCVVKNCGSTDANGQYLDSPVGTVKPQYFQSETFTQTTFLWDGTKGSWPGTQVSRTTWTTIPNPSIMGPNGGVIIGQGSIRNSWSYGP